MKRYLSIALLSLGFAGGAQAQPGPADVQAILGNLQPTVEALTTGLQNTAETLATTQSAVQTSQALGDTVANTVNTSINGAPTLGSFSLVVDTVEGGVQNTLNPALTAIDNPSAANIQAALAPQDLATIAQNLQPAIEAATPGLKQATIDLLNGNLREPFEFGGLLPGGGVVFEGLSGVSAASIALFDGTNLQPLADNPLLSPIPVTSIAVPTAADPVLEPLDGPAMQLGDAGAPLTDPIIDVIQQTQL